MIENNNKASGRFHEVIKTKRVFIEDNQVFMRRDTDKQSFSDRHGEVWYPIQLEWICV